MKKHRFYWIYLLMIIGILFAASSFVACEEEDKGDDDDDDTTTDDDDDTTDDDDDIIDDDDTTTTTCYEDLDRDGFGNPDQTDEFTGDDCPAGWVSNDLDCDDKRMLINPESIDFPDDGIDQDCDGADFVHSEEVGIFVDGFYMTSKAIPDGSMNLPYMKIQDGIDKAETFDPPKAVFVAKGLYDENVETSVSLYGGYANASGSWTRDIAANVTTVRAVIETAIAVVAPLKSNKEDEPIVIEGFDVAIHTFIDKDQPEKGNQEKFGITVNDLGKVMIAHNVISDNMVAHGGRDFFGLQISNSTIVIYENTFNTGNSDSIDIKSYGCLIKDQSHAIVLKNKINLGELTGQSSPSTGIDIQDSDAQISNNMIFLGSGFQAIGISFYTNASGTCTNNYIGGKALEGDIFGVLAWEADVVLVNNTISIDHISAKKATTYGTGIYLTWQTVNTFINNIIDVHSTSVACGIYNAVYSASDNEIYLANNDFYVSGGTEGCKIKIHDTGVCLNDLADVDICDWYGCQLAVNNISENPDFDVDGFHLVNTSGCIDKGTTPEDYYSDGMADMDIDRDRRPAGTDWDIGMDEYTTK